jgi:hypothetical protein
MLTAGLHPPANKNMKTALFTNFTDKPFTGYWNGKGKTFAPGQSVYMPDYLAQHFAKHLTNRELLRTDSLGNLVHPNGDKMTSPKKPQEVSLFMEIFNKAYAPDDAEELGEEKDSIDVQIEVANKNRQKSGKASLPKDEPSPKKESRQEEQQDPTKPQTLPEVSEDEDEEFGGAPVETPAA